MNRYIDADNLLNSIYAYVRINSQDVDYIVRLIQEAPTADVVERKKGEWISHYDYCKKYGYIPSGLISLWWCDQCEQGAEHPTNFCPNCGAEMEVNDGKIY